MSAIYSAIGLMSGTSLDGIDVAWIKTDGETIIDFKGAACYPYKADFKKRMMNLAKTDIALNDVLRLEQELTLHHADAVHAFLSENNLKSDDIDIIGFHGQTIRHLPEEGLTWQLGNASLLAETTGIKVCADMRKRDMAVGGQGAPLAPLYHAALFGNEHKPTAVLNIGGVSNLTYIGSGSLDIHAGDCGPGMGLMDAFVEQQTNNTEHYDEGGMYAFKGELHEKIIEKAMADIPFFNKPFPKSADRYDFDSVNVSALSLEDGCATLAGLTAYAIYECITECPSMPKSLWVTGGGARNHYVMAALRELLEDEGCLVSSVEDKNLRSDSMEAECFAWMAVRSLKGKELSVPNTTGCQSGVTGGIITAK